MTPVRTALAGVIALVLLVVLSFGWATSTPEPATAQDAGCIVQLEGTLGFVICGGELVQQINLPTVKVTQTVLEQIVKEIEVPGPTIRVVGPTETITVRVPAKTTAPAETVTAPGPTKTVTVPEDNSTVTETVTTEPTRQSTPSDDRVVTDDETPSIDFGDGETTLVEAGLGALSIVAMMVLLLLAMYGGYAMGWKNKERDETIYMAALLDRARMRRDKSE